MFSQLRQRKHFSERSSCIFFQHGCFLGALTTNIAEDRLKLHAAWGGLFSQVFLHQALYRRGILLLEQLGLQ